MTENERNILIAKFDRNVAKRSRVQRLLLVIDQFFAVLFWNASQDETVLSHIGRKIENGTANWFDRKLCCLLKKLENNHCNKSKGE